MDSKIFNLPGLPEFNKTSVYPGGFSVETYMYSFTLKIASMGKTILKLDCGWNDNDAELVDAYGELQCVDTNQEVVNYLKEISKKYEGSLFANLSDGENLPFYDHSFDVVISSRVSKILLSSYYREVWRIIRPGGYLIATLTGEKDLLSLKQAMGRGTNFFDGDYLEKTEAKLNTLITDKQYSLIPQKIANYYYKDLHHDLVSSFSATLVIHKRYLIWTTIIQRTRRVY